MGDKITRDMKRFFWVFTGSKGDQWERNSGCFFGFIESQWGPWLMQAPTSSLRWTSAESKRSCQLGLWLTLPLTYGTLRINFSAVFFLSFFYVTFSFICWWTVSIWRDTVIFLYCIIDGLNFIYLLYFKIYIYIIKR